MFSESTVASRKQVTDAGFAAESTVAKKLEPIRYAAYARDHNVMCVSGREWGRYCWCLGPCCWQIYGHAESVLTSRVGKHGRCICLSCPCRQEDRTPW